MAARVSQENSLNLYKLRQRNVANKGAANRLSNPVNTITSPATEPSSPPTSCARLTPAPWAPTPNNAPRAKGVRSGNHLSSTPPSMAPNTPVNITNTAVSSGTPPRSEDTGMANGVVIERGNKDRVTELFNANALASPNEVPMEAALPATIPSSNADQWRANKRRCCQIGTANATVTGPSTSINQCVSVAYSA